MTSLSCLLFILFSHHLSTPSKSTIIVEEVSHCFLTTDPHDNIVGQIQPESSLYTYSLLGDTNAIYRE